MNQKNNKVIIEVPEEMIRGSFINAIKEVESLYDFYVTFRDSWQKNKLQFEEKNSTALKLHELITEILDDENYREKYEEYKSHNVNGVTFDDIIELSFDDSNSEVKDDGIKMSYSLKKPFDKIEVYDPQVIKLEYKKIDNQHGIFVRSILSNIVIVFERYFSQVFEYMVALNPEKYFEGQTMKISDLLYAHPMQLFFKEVRKLVEANMFDSVATLEKMKSRSKFDIDRHMKIRDDFEEIYYRRNIFVHNAGVVNEIYLNNVLEKYKDNVKIGDHLTCDDVYIQNALNVLKKVICACYYELIHTNTLDIALVEFLAEKVIFAALRNKEYDFTKDVYNMLSKDLRINFADKTMYHVNYMISLKQAGEPINKFIELFDVSAMKNAFKLAKECLLDHNDKVYEMLSKMYQTELPAEAIRDWPLFIDFRKSSEYEKFKNEHIDDFNQYIFEEQVDQESEMDILQEYNNQIYDEFKCAGE